MINTVFTLINLDIFLFFQSRFFTNVVFIYRLNPVIEAHSTNWSRRSKPTTMNVLKKSRSIGVVPLLETSPLQGSTSKTKLNLQNLLLKPKQNCFSNGNKGISKKHFFSASIQSRILQVFTYTRDHVFGFHCSSVLHLLQFHRCPKKFLAGILIKISRTAAFPTKILEFLSHPMYLPLNFPTF